MLRIIFAVIISIPSAIVFLLRAHYIKVHFSKYTEEQRYAFIRKYAETLKRNARIVTISSGKENLPPTGGYIMYPNHQGKYDAVGIITEHYNPLTVVMDAKRSHLPLATQLMTVLDGTRLDRTSPRTQVESFFKISQNVTEGKRYILFPEGGYSLKDFRRGHTDLKEFKPGSFKCAIRAKCPIVPVALIDSWKPFGQNSLRKVTTQVHFLPPLTYDEYKDKSTREIAEEVRSRIIQKIASLQQNTNS